MVAILSLHSPNILICITLTWWERIAINMLTNINMTVHMMASLSLRRAIMASYISMSWRGQNTINMLRSQHRILGPCRSDSGPLSPAYLINTRITSCMSNVLPGHCA